MIKANGYGHGLEWVIETLKDQPHLRGFGVASIQEAHRARQALGQKHAVLLFSESGPWAEDLGAFCVQNQITPVVSSLSDLKHFLQGQWAARLRYHLKFNTGMDRLGIGIEELNDVQKLLRTLPETQRPEGICSHLASSETPRSPLTLKQSRNFTALTRELRSTCPKAEIHVFNSGGIFHFQKHFASVPSDFARPGLALYGISPAKDLKIPALRPVLSLWTRVIQVRHIQKGDRVGYSGTYKAKKAETTATLAMGYGDGLHRALQNGGRFAFGSKKLPLVGRISMDLSAVLCSKVKLKPGDKVQVMGPLIDPWTQALSAGTIPYEMLVQLTDRVPRIHL